MSTPPPQGAVSPDLLEKLDRCLISCAACIGVGMGDAGAAHLDTAQGLIEEIRNGVAQQPAVTLRLARSFKTLRHRHPRKMARGRKREFEDTAQGVREIWKEESTGQ